MALQARNRALIQRARVWEGRCRKEQALRLAAERRVAELEERLSANTTNSSLPPSANPRGAPRPMGKRPTGRKRGGQIGHKGRGRKLIPVEQVDEVVDYRPAVCESCLAGLEDAGGEVVGRHQVAELPVRAVKVTEHRSIACRCGRCGTVSRGLIPPELRKSVAGPRLTGAIGLLGGFVHGSRRALREMVAEVLGCPIALGSISRRERELSAALKGSHDAIAQQVSQAKVKYVDETGWKRKGIDRWLFAAATSGASVGDAAVFHVARHRIRSSLKALLNGKLRGVFCTDRFGIYNIIPLKRRGFCWAHLKRDFARCLERGGRSGAIGRVGLEVSAEVFRLWRRWQAKELTRSQLQEQATPARAKLHAALRRGAELNIRKTSGLCRTLLKREEAMWNWTKTPGLEPTNNLAERMLRPAVIWRKKSFGSDSERGCVYVERMLSVIQTLRLRRQNVLTHLAASVEAHRRNQPPPPLPGPAG